MQKPSLLIAIAAVALAVPLAGQQVKVLKAPPKPPAYAAVTMTDDINSAGATVQVGRDVATYGPVNQQLFVHESLLPPSGSTAYPGVVEELRALGPDSEGFYGPYSGQIRVLNDRLDYWFDTTAGCGEAMTSAMPCRFRAVVADGTAVYSGTGRKKTLAGIAFNEGRYLLDYRWCDPAIDPACYVKLYGCYDDRDCPGVPPGGNGYVYTNVYVRFE